MSKYLTRTQSPAESLQERLRARLAGTQGTGKLIQYPQTTALLLDVSGSMGIMIGVRDRAIDALRRLVKDFPGVRRFQFSDSCEELKQDQEISDPNSGTHLMEALETVKLAGIQHVVLLTDGAPTASCEFRKSLGKALWDPCRAEVEEACLQAAKGLKVDIIFVGRPPEPDFLARLAGATGGSYGSASLTALKELGAGVRALLGLPEASQSGTETIKL